MTTVIRNLFENELPSDNCPMCGAPGGACNDYLSTERLLNPDPGARVLVEADIYENAEADGKLVRWLKWRAGEFITQAEADRLGVRQVPFVVRLDRERTQLQEALGMQGMGENKMLRSPEDKSVKPVEDRAESDQGGKEDQGSK